MIDAIRKNLDNTIKEADFQLGDKYRGKVRDNYTLEDRQERVIIVTDRISAFDVVLDTIPFKGQVLNQLARFWFEETKDVAKSHFKSSPDPNVMVVTLCKPYPVEVIVRGYITGSLWREYEKGQDNYGLRLPAGLKPDQKFDEPILTPSTKADEGHDMPMTREQVVELIGEETYAKMEQTAIKLFKRGQEIATKRGLILVDTKYEFGQAQNGEILLIDEIHTPDSSRYWVADEYEEHFKKGEKQHMLDKEFLRQWLIERNYMGEGEPPTLTHDIRVAVAQKYIELYELITGKKFEIVEGDVHQRLRKNLIKAGYEV